MPKLNDTICPTCGDKGVIVTTSRLGGIVHAQWICNSDHRWSSRSKLRNDLANYVTISITDMECEHA